MGCDIHFYIEVQQKDGTWAPPPEHVVKCDNCEGTGVDPERSVCKNCGNARVSHEKKTKKCFFGSAKMNIIDVPCIYGCYQGETVNDVMYGGRNYKLFGILSGVRGEPVDGFTCEDYSLPADASPILRRISGIDSDGGTDYHSHTSYTLLELQAFDWADSGCTEFLQTVQAMAQFHKDPECVRALLWYDN